MPVLSRLTVKMSSSSIASFLFFFDGINNNNPKFTTSFEPRWSTLPRGCFLSEWIGPVVPIAYADIDPSDLMGVFSFSFSPPRAAGLPACSPSLLVLF
jgi:hypothetical protein